MDQQQLTAALQAEYLHLQKTIEDFDSKALTIKAWSISFSLTVLVGAFASRASPVLLIASVASLLFWFLETMWKVFQLGYYERVEEIEAHFRGELKGTAPNQICTSWMKKWNATPWSDVRGMALWPHIALPHGVIVVIGIVLFALVRAGLLTL
ncbi:MAG: hypothetical protein EPN31_16210 [Castellaniella sp.]|uniref:hypothetical protein n=1 Tax=Castellaniella sp. TaxID=1955812 RepID=UPI00120E6D37|nr:hypothetical protein [Castellaniella sp.]TAN25030.1 MAG: hypothetical protein EPN31_16210 [Castellaniella sp.]